MIIVFDIGGTSIKYGLINNQGTLLYREEMPTLIKQGGVAVIRQVIEKVMQTKQSHDVCGIAISSAGVIEPYQGIVLATTSTFKDYTGLHIKTMIEQETGLFTTVENDVNCAALAETVYGLNEPKDFIAMTIGTGIGGAIISHGNVYHGASFSAGEWGRMMINGKQFETIASTASILRLAHSKGLDIHSGEALFALYDQGNEVATEVIKHFYHNLALGIKNLVYALNPSLIIIGGGISNRGQTFINELYDALAEELEPIFLASLSLKTATLKNDSGMLGAYVHHLQQINKK